MGERIKMKYQYNEAILLIGIFIVFTFLIILIFNTINIQIESKRLDKLNCVSYELSECYQSVFSRCNVSNFGTFCILNNGTKIKI